jgi:hypothetical protein
MEALKQSNAEIFRIAKDWEELYAPANLIRDAHTASLLVEWVIANEGIASFTGFNHAVAALGSQVLTPEPKPLTQEERAAIFQKKEFARIQREQLENSKPFAERAVAAEKARLASKEETQRQASAWKERDRLIDAYSINLGPGRIDHTRSEYFKGQLRQIDYKKNGKTDWVEVLKMVQEALSKMP